MAGMYFIRHPAFEAAMLNIPLFFPQLLVIHSLDLTPSVIIPCAAEADSELARVGRRLYPAKQQEQWETFLLPSWKRRLNSTFLEESVFPRSGGHAVVSAAVAVASSQGLRRQKSIASNESPENSQNSLCKCQGAFCDN